MTLLLLSLVALWIGPIVAARYASRAGVLAALDAMVKVSIGGMILLHILPASIDSLGAWALLWALGGFALPTIADRVLAKVNGSHPTWRQNTWRFLFGVLPLLVHALFDGLVLPPHPQDHQHLNEWLGVAVVLHRLPVGLAVWRFLKPYSARAVHWTLMALAAATAGGFLWATQAWATVPLGLVAALQAVMAGALLHVVGWLPSLAKGQPTGVRRAALWGVAAACLLLWLMWWMHPAVHAL